MNLLPHLPFWAELAVFLASAVTIWVAGIFLSKNTDVLADRLHLGQALGGLILLAVATNLPEIAITYSAAASGQLDVAVSNILGGIAIQTVVLVALDAFGVRERRPLTYQAASLTLVIEGAVVLAVLVAVVMGTQLPTTLIRFRLTPDVVLIAVIWVVGLLLTQRAGNALPWKDSGEAPDSQPEPRGHSQTKHAQTATRKGVSTARAALVFGVAALATLVAGALAEESGTAAADHVGLSGVLFGATVLAAATSLPELSTGLTSVREGDYKLAFGDIFGGNAFLPVLFLLAVLVSGKAVLPNAHASDIYLRPRSAADRRLHRRAAVPTHQGTRPARHRQHRRPGPVHRRRHRAHRATQISHAAGKQTACSPSSVLRRPSSVVRRPSSVLRRPSSVVGRRPSWLGERRRVDSTCPNPQYLVSTRPSQIPSQSVGHVAREPAAGVGVGVSVGVGVLTPRLQRLQSKGLVARGRRSDDKCSVSIGLTDKGADLRQRGQRT